MNKYHYEIIQGTDEWHKMRLLRFTASKASIIKTAGKGLETLINEMIQAYFSSGENIEFSKYKNEDMQRGNDYEQSARNVFELVTGKTVEQVGCVTVGEHILASPDGLIGDDELIEIKCHSDKVFTELILTEKIDTKYIDQMQYQMWVTGRKRCNYFGYNPNFEPCYFHRVIEADESYFKLFENGVKIGTVMLKEKIKILEEKGYKPNAEI